MGRRLAISLFVSLLVAGLLISQAALWWLEQEQRGQLVEQLRTDAAGVLAALEPGLDGALTLRNERLHPAYRRPYSGRYFIVETSQARWRSRSLWDAPLAPPVAPGVASGLLEGPAEQLLLGYQEQYQVRGQSVTVSVAQDYSPVRQAYQRARAAMLVSWPLILALLALVQQWLLRRGLSPLRRARAEIEQLRQGKRSVLTGNVVRELQPLVEEINRLQQHTEQQLQRSRHAMGDLGHALKTPLAVLKNRCNPDLRLNDPDLHQLMHDQVSQMEGQVRRALSRARVAAGATAANRFSPEEDLPLVIMTLERAHDRQLAFEIRGLNGATLPFEREDMLELFGNLLDNAFKWADSRIAVRFELDEVMCVAVVEDDGPGIPPARRDTVLHRGERLDERQQGYGLGLAIAHDLAVAYQGTLALQDSDPGGLAVKVCLPLPR
ncbi:sensor histidine kinase [Alcanivorax profundi]|uniref:histidine kinase n=2 Tax=Alcanivorax profundi TaxID=2338368 RepID=A0A418XXP8_9GAMM|nr:sensor histidine kinase [Alcanivorax profundi]